MSKDEELGPYPFDVITRIVLEEAGYEMPNQECEFCNEEMDEDSVACQFCDGIFCGSECFDAHLIGFPRCGGQPPQAIINAARKRWEGPL